MKPITEEWVNKAEGDFATAQREIQVENKPLSIRLSRDRCF